jgi:hypothetical protein
VSSPAFRKASRRENAGGHLAPETCCRPAHQVDRAHWRAQLPASPDLGIETGVCWFHSLKPSARRLGAGGRKGTAFDFVDGHATALRDCKPLLNFSCYRDMQNRI